MTGKSPRKKVDALYWQGRLRVAQAYLEAAQQAHLLAEVGQDCNPVISQIVLSAIGFGDTSRPSARRSSTEIRLADHGPKSQIHSARAAPNRSEIPECRHISGFPLQRERGGAPFPMGSSTFTG
jgi:hypothetical protein